MTHFATIVFWLRLLYRSSVRVERKLDKLLEQQQGQAELLKLSRTLNDATDRLKQAMASQK